MTQRLVGDLSAVPPSGWGTKSLWFWGIMGFMVIEGTGFVLAMGTYLYLMTQAKMWPLSGGPPDLLWGTALTVVLLLSLMPNAWVYRISKQRDLKKTRLGLVMMTLIGLLPLILRVMEFQHLNVRWDQNAYGSVAWALMLLHTTHILTDFGDTAILTVFVFTHEVDEERFSDVDTNAVYWAFVVAIWLPIYALVYWAPRLA
jgi:heme/copper-type cytochrome/quinol oxidase subunit 3